MKKKLKLTALLAILLMLAAGLASCDCGGSLRSAGDISLSCDNEIYFIDIDFDDDGVGKITVKAKERSDYDRAVEVWLEGGPHREMLARGYWINDGFTIILPETLDSNFLEPLLNQRYSLPHPIMLHQAYPPTMSVSNENVRIRTVVFRKNGHILSLCKIDKDGIVHGVYLIYVDSDVTISGYKRAFLVQDEACRCGISRMMVNWDKTIIYSINWKRGWNIWFFSEFGLGAERKITQRWSTMPAAN